MNDENSTFGKRLLATLAARDLKQSAVAELVGTSQGNVSRWINDVNPPTPATAKFLAAKLGVSHDWLMHGLTGGQVHPLKAAREKAGLTIRELSQKTGYAIGVLQAVESGARASEGMLRKLGSVLPGFCADTAMNASDEPNVLREDGAEGSYGATPPPGAEGRYVPLFSFAQAGAYALTSTDEAWTGESVFAHGVKKATDGFWLKIEGDSMTPSINPGDQVLVRCDKEPRRGSPVVVKTTRSEVFCKYWSGIKDGIVTLKSSNPAHPDLILAAEEIAFVYPVGEIRHILPL